MRSSDEDGLPTDPVHVDASASFKVIQVDVAIFGDEKDHILLGADLHERKQTMTSIIFDILEQKKKKPHRSTGYGNGFIIC